jgi:uncharacterized protein YbjT (DUF2867 family)
MFQRWQFLLLAVLGGIVLLLVLTNEVLSSGNRRAQQAVAARAQYIQQSQAIEPVYRSILRTLAELAAKNHDEQIRQLLASQGINYTVTAPSAAKGAPPGKPATEPAASSAKRPSPADTQKSGPGEAP